jgi:transglutaminase-like putative cysteine protease
MRYRLSHRTSYSYSSSVDTAHHLAHLRARDFPGQHVLTTEVIAKPHPSLGARHIDYFGNHIDVYRIEEPHTRFEIEVKADIEVSLPTPPAAQATPAWEEVRERLNGGGFPDWIEASEFVHDSPLVPATDGSLRDYGAQSLRPGRPILEAAREITSRIKSDFKYLPGSTDVSTPLHEVFSGRSGVCQDFAHVEIAALRAHGLAARYVSGYIRTVQSADQIALRGADASHAWVMVWCGDEAGWVHLDPTNDLIAHEDHVTVAWGRDFSDVSPIRGVILGGGAHSYGVAVQLVPLT